MSEELLRQYHAKVARLENTNAVLQRDYERAQQRTFDLSERIAQERARADALRPLIRELVMAAVPSMVENGRIWALDADNLWRRAWTEASELPPTAASGGDGD